jgi:glutamyl-tRNA reductase
MNVQVIYCNHLTAAIQVREKLAFSQADELLRAYKNLRDRFPQSEHVVVSTCNRIELYSAQEKAEDAPSTIEVARFLAEFHHVPVDEFLGDLLTKSGPDAVSHLFEVASSIDSMVLGENQIVNQVKEAYDLATQGEANGPLTHALFHRALQASKRVRTETKLSEGRTSIASVAVGDFGKSIFNRFDDKLVLVIGAGEMAAETLQYLKSEGVRRIIICNRGRERADQLALTFGGEVQPYDSLDRWLGEADVIVSTTGASEPIVSRERFRQAREKSGIKPVFILDLGAPRDFDPRVADVDEEVYLYDIDDLQATCERNRLARHGEIELARRIIAEETASFMHEVHHKTTGPVVKRLRENWHDLSRQELDQLFRKLSHLSDDDRRQIDRAIERIVNKLLHPPLETLRDEARTGPPHGLIDALKRLFHIGDDA